MVDDETWFYVVEVKATCEWHWERLGQFKSQSKAVAFSEQARKNSKLVKLKTSYRVVPVKFMD